MAASAAIVKIYRGVYTEAIIASQLGSRCIVGANMSTASAVRRITMVGVSTGTGATVRIGCAIVCKATRVTVATSFYVW